MRRPRGRRQTWRTNRAARRTSSTPRNASYSRSSAAEPARPSGLAAYSRGFARLSASSMSRSKPLGGVSGSSAGASLRMSRSGGSSGSSPNCNRSRSSQLSSTSSRFSAPSFRRKTIFVLPEPRTFPGSYKVMEVKTGGRCVFSESPKRSPGSCRCAAHFRLGDVRGELTARLGLPRRKIPGRPCVHELIEDTTGCVHG